MRPARYFFVIQLSNSRVLSLSVHFDRIRYLSMTKNEFILRISEHEQYSRL